ncbi:M23 family metallopeptidase [Compostibacter hankyongensis]|uniref:M23 family metallopeptidase n=2 Tax=Compostibacter hankyongensis TaxID=1007089 RepID=A0ABP8FES7_9BACT
MLALLLLPGLSKAQQFPEPHYPQNYFRNPLDIPMLLAGNVGELRPGHFHSGLDIKTNGHIGMRVHAAADGYISRVGVSSTGFGNVIYISHPNGYTTLYGHLHRFNPALEQYVKKQQYRQERWAVDLDLMPGLFPVKKGQFIAWSGSTGSSVAPHLHFEIRKTVDQHPLNGLLFGFEVRDNIPPSVYRIAVYDRDKSLYEQTPQVYSLKKSGGLYRPSLGTIRVKAARAGFGISTIDHENGTTNTYGVYRAVVYDDDRPSVGFQLDDVGYEETRYVDAHTDYKTHHSGGPYYELLFSLPGNRLPIYHNFEGDGTVDLSDGAVHAIKIAVKDAGGNTSTVSFNIQQDPAAKPEQKSPCANRMTPGIKNIFENNHVEFYLDETALYDDICFRYKTLPAPATGYYSDIYCLHNPDVPLYTSFTLRLRPDKPVPPSLRSKMVIVRTEPRSGRHEVRAASWSGAWLEASFRDFGNFAVQADTTPPVITPVGLHSGISLANATRMAFRIRDGLSGIKSYRAMLDGRWLMFAQDGSTIYYTFDEHCPRGSHRLELTVTDEANNTATYLLTFKR